MLLPFLIVGGFGLVLLVVSLVVGDVLDHLDVGNGFLSGTALSVGLVVFGASGVLAASFGWEPVWAYVLAVVVALVAYAVSTFAVRSLTRSSDGTPVSAVGLTGVTTAPVGPAGGEVRLEGPGELERRLAFADQAIDSGVRIRVVEHDGGRVKVIPV